MTLLESLKIELGTDMPKFALEDPSKKAYATDKVMGEKGLLIVFTCNHCPYAQAVWKRIINLSQKAKELGINTVAINPNINPEYPDDSPEEMKILISELGVNFPYLVDEDQQTAKDFNAQCTPDIYLVDNRNKLVYHGRVDDNWQDEKKVKKQDLLQAIASLAKGSTPLDDQYPSMGCSIKWV